LPEARGDAIGYHRQDHTSAQGEDAESQYERVGSNGHGKIGKILWILALHCVGLAFFHTMFHDAIFGYCGYLFGNAVYWGEYAHILALDLISSVIEPQDVRPTDECDDDEHREEIPGSERSRRFFSGFWRRFWRRFWRHRVVVRRIRNIRSIGKNREIAKKSSEMEDELFRNIEFLVSSDEESSSTPKCSFDLFVLCFLSLSFSARRIPLG